MLVGCLLFDVVDEDVVNCFVGRLVEGGLVGGGGGGGGSGGFKMWVCLFTSWTALNDGRFDKFPPLKFLIYLFKF